MKGRTVRQGMTALVTLTLAGAFALAANGTAAARQSKSKGDAARGRDIFVQQKCSLCHMVGTTGGRFGPELTSVGERRNAEWLLAYLPKPQASNPTNKMPPVAVKGQDLDDLVAYLVSLKGSTRD